MRIIKYVLPLFLALVSVSCFEDETTSATRPLSEITIDAKSVSSEYNVNKNEVLEIAPVITQTNRQLPLSYSWEIDQKVVSNDEVFVYKATTLGVFDGRLIVENEDGKAFHPFKLYVNSPYEEGITVLSKDADGKSMLSFMQKATSPDEEQKFYEGDCFAINNEGLFFASNASDIIQTSGSVIIACQGGDASPEDEATIYFLNEKTFVMENIVKGGEYPTFKPTKLLTPGESAEGVSYPVLSADGKVYALPTYNALLQPSPKLLSTYAQTAFVAGESASYYDVILWDKEVNDITLVYNGYGPYYCGSKYLLMRNDSAFSSDEYYVKNFSKLKGVRTLTYIHRTKEQMQTSRRELIAIVEAPLMLQKVVIATFFWEPVAGKTGEYVVLDNNGFKKAASRNYTLINENTPCIANATFKTMLFANGNKVMKWFYTKEEKEGGKQYLLEDAEVLLTVGSDDAVITSFEISDDHKTTYVAFYEPNQDGLNGSVWVFDTDNGVVLEKYDNVCYQPVKMFYKKK